MKRNFREFYLDIDPQRRARTVLGVVKSRLEYMASKGPRAVSTFDASEYLIDEATVAAYVSLVNELGDPYVSRLAAYDADRARRRIAEEQIRSRQHSVAEEDKLKSADQVVISRNIPSYPTVTEVRRSSRAALHPTKRGTIYSAFGAKSKSKDWALKRLSKDSLT